MFYIDFYNNSLYTFIVISYLFFSYYLLNFILYSKGGDYYGKYRFNFAEI